MATDLTNIYDHPAVMLETMAAERGGDLPENPGEMIADAAKRLRDYEQKYGVTFAALDNSVLERLRAAYESITTVDYAEASSRVEEFIGAVRDLLGLDDE